MLSEAEERVNSAVDEANRVKDENVRLREDIRSLERKLASASKGEQQQNLAVPQAHLWYDAMPLRLLSPSGYSWFLRRACL